MPRKQRRNERAMVRRLKRSAELVATLDAIALIERIERRLEDVYESVSRDAERFQQERDEDEEDE